MKKIGYIIAREYWTRVRKKSFLLTTLLAPLGMILLVGATVFFQKYAASTKQIAVIDDSGFFKEINFADEPDGSLYYHKISNFEEALSSFSKTEKPTYTAIVHIPAGFNFQNPTHPGITYLAKEKAGLVTQKTLNEIFSKKIQSIAAQSFQLDEQKIKALNVSVKLNYQTLSEGKDKDGYMLIAAGVGYFVGLSIYLVLIIYGTMILKGVMEEKNSRVMEILASSVKPFQLMIGKVIGIGAVGLTQFLIWIILIFLTQLFLLPILGLSGMNHSSMMADAAVSGNQIDPDSVLEILTNLQAIPKFQIIVFVLIYFLGGFLMYGSWFAALGAAGGDGADSQSLVFPITLPIIISIMMLMGALAEPEGKLAFWGSILPFSSPVIMPAMIPFHPPWWQILLSLSLLVLGFLGSIYVAAKIYRMGFLMYGKKVTLAEIGKWIFQK